MTALVFALPVLAFLAGPVAYAVLGLCGCGREVTRG
jgi:hypothetical protein